MAPLSTRDFAVPARIITIAWDTGVDSVFAQFIMDGALILTAATIGRASPNASLDSVQQIADTITSFMHIPE